MLFSIITINRNNASGLDRTMESVVSQMFDDYEYIVIDGASTDDSVQVIRKYDDLSDKIKWVSEPDSGIYNAMNKGVKMAGGTFLLFMNSGDWMHDKNVLRNVACHMNADNDIVLGRTVVIDDSGRKRETDMLDVSTFTLFNLYMSAIPHQAAFIRRSLFDNNLYDESLLISSDWKFFIESIAFRGAAVKSIPDLVSFFDGTGISSTNVDLAWKEREEILKTLLPEAISNDYLAVASHYYEVVRVKWLLAHPFFYRVYRLWASLGIRLFG